MAQPRRSDSAGADRPGQPGNLIIQVVAHSGARRVIRVAGRLDARAAPALARELAAAAPSPGGGPPQLAIDLSGVTYIDGTGLQVLLDAQERLTADSGALELLSPTPAVVGLLHEAHIHGTAGLPGTDCSASGLAWDGSLLDGRAAPPIR